MSFEEQKQSSTFEAGGDLSTAQYTFVELASDGQVDQVSSAGGGAIGVLQNAPGAAGRAATVTVLGSSKVVAGAVVAAGADVQSDAQGRAITAASGDVVLGVAREAAAAAGDVISVLLISKHTNA